MSVSRNNLRRSCRAIAPHLDRELAKEHGERVGFVLLLFDFSDGTVADVHGSLAYISNAKRDGMVSTLKEITARLEAGIESDPPGPKVGHASSIASLAISRSSTSDAAIASSSKRGPLPTSRRCTSAPSASPPSSPSRPRAT